MQLTESSRLCGGVGVMCSRGSAQTKCKIDLQYVCKHQCHMIFFVFVFNHDYLLPVPVLQTQMYISTTQHTVKYWQYSTTVLPVHCTVVPEVSLQHHHDTVITIILIICGTVQLHHVCGCVHVLYSKIKEYTYIYTGMSCFTGCSLHSMRYCILLYKQIRSSLLL